MNEITVGTIVRTPATGRFYTKGTVTRIYRKGTKGNWRLEVQPENHIEWFIKTGHDNWQYAALCKAMPRLTARTNK